MKYGHNAMMKRRNEANIGKPPKGFDITLVQVMDTMNLDKYELAYLGHMTSRGSGLAHATIGNTVWYRERQVKELIVGNVPEEFKQVVDLRDGKGAIEDLGKPTLRTLDKKLANGEQA
jgi:hypothetical protein